MIGQPIREVSRKIVRDDKPIGNRMMLVKQFPLCYFLGDNLESLSESGEFSHHPDSLYTTTASHILVM
jgi:hypothetical protein